MLCFVLTVIGYYTTRRRRMPKLSLPTTDLREYQMPQVFFAVIDPMKIGRGASRVKESKEHHAGELEISEVWYKYPHLIKADKLTEETPDLRQLFSPFFQDDLFNTLYHSSGLYSVCFRSDLQVVCWFGDQHLFKKYF